MFTRGYFALRNAIPGYAFILIVIAINHVPLMEILQKPGFSEFFGVFLAFFYLLSGGAIGFLISQGWWWYWQKQAGILGDKEYTPAVNAFSKLYGVDVPPKKIYGQEDCSLVPWITLITQKSRKTTKNC